MHIDYSAPKAHTSLFSQIVKEDTQELAQAKQGSQTINLAAIHSNEPEINYAQIEEEEPAVSDEVPAQVTIVEDMQSELAQQTAQPIEANTALSQVTEPAWGAAVNDALPKQSLLAQIDVEAVAEAQEADINRIASMM